MVKVEEEDGELEKGGEKKEEDIEVERGREE